MKTPRSRSGYKKKLRMLRVSMQIRGVRFIDPSDPRCTPQERSENIEYNHWKAKLLEMGGD